ncbi:unnamed protein product [Parnassius apollo]|uniref:(apollo) hypothetical protein n=1 Tax=Parnassius apollo TaxID=110799 RepID=A0A8S3WKG1_PARAO|nr:unnamed protein product [Parnassius apollo]
MNQNHNELLTVSSASPLKQNEQEVDQKKINIESDTNNEVTEKYGDTEVDIVIEESINGVPNDFAALGEEASLIIEGEGEAQEPQSIFDSFSDVNEMLNKDPEEIMETAAGFVPIPIMRNRHKPRRRFATRRNFRRNPYPFRRFYFYYPYPFYHYGSLRFY